MCTAVGVKHQANLLVHACTCILMVHVLCTALFLSYML